MPKTLTTTIPIERTRLANGLRVVFAPDRSSPAVFVAVYYDVGFRSEPKGRTGFAHLFEHLMFQGSATLEKGMHDSLVTGNGGILNGSTRNDFTNYFDMMPSNALEIALFLEADRMRAVRLTSENLQNQVDVVKEEILVNVKNQPYGGFPWLYLPMALFTTFPNAHDAYGDFADLDAATLEDAADFFDRYYPPSNAVLAIAGEVDPDDAAAIIERHFGSIEERPAPPPVDASEPVPSAERRVVHPDPNAPQPAVAIAYRVPDPIAEFDDYCAAVLLSSILIDGEASRLYQRLVKTGRLASHVTGDVGLVAGTFEVRGPSMLHLAAWYPGTPDPDRILAAIDEEVSRVADGVDAEELDRFRSSYIADYLGSVDALSQRGMLIAAFEQQRANAELINEIPSALARVQADDVARMARAWLQPHSRAVLDVHPGANA
ncbi:MAG: insulinase family protein [Actinobacteria bacterium]|nr:MAG: insulinase family protein [Actinomycetota bacterium]